MQICDLVDSLIKVLSEILDDATSAAWLLNPGDPGLLRSLDNLSAAMACNPATEVPTIASHVDHVR